MSGGHFDYKQHFIESIADSIEHELEKQGKNKSKEELYMDEEYYKKYPEEKIYPVYSKKVQKELNNAIKHLRAAYIYAQRADWFLSGDDGEESFLSRLSKDIKDLKERQKYE